MRWSILVLFLTGCLATGQAIEVGGAAPRFVLTDARGQFHEVPSASARPTVLIFADREGSRHLAEWVRRLHDAWGERIDIRGVATLKEVPPFLRPVVRRLFRGPESDRVLLDWTGAVSESYAYQKGHTHVFVIGLDGRLLWAGAGTAEEGRLQECLKTLRSEMLSEEENPVPIPRH